MFNFHRGSDSADERGRGKGKTVAPKVIGGLVGFGIAVAGIAVGIHSLQPRITLSKSVNGIASAHLSGPGFHLTQASVRFQNRSIPLHLDGNTLSVASYLPAGKTGTLTVTAFGNSWDSWLWGRSVRASKTVMAPQIRPLSDVLVAQSGQPLIVKFTSPVRTVTWNLGSGTVSHVVRLSSPSKAVTIGSPLRAGSAGSIMVSASGPTWVKPTPFFTLTYLVADGPVLSVLPGHTVTSLNAPIKFIASEPITKLFGSKLPSIVIALANTKPPGKWSRPNRNTAEFTPAPGSLWPGQTLQVTLPSEVALLDPGALGNSQGLRTRSVQLQTAAGSILRAQQLLSTLGFLPLKWHASSPSGTYSSLAAEQAMAYSAPLGTFSWQWSPPARLAALWQPGSDSAMTAGAIMAFEHQNGLDPVGTSNPLFWPTLVKQAAAHNMNPNGYSWVDVNMALPQKAMLWHDGKTLVSSAVNTGIPQTPTAIGTFPVYLRYPYQIMRGVNPNGSHYADPVHWVNYFNASQAVHGYVRSSYGFPQSLGCVELPVAQAHAMYPYLHIGSIVTVHN